MGSDPLHWLAAAVRTLCKRVDGLDVLVEDLGKRVDAGSAPACFGVASSSVIDDKIAEQVRGLKTSLLDEMVSSMQLVVDELGLARTSDVEKLRMTGNYEAVRVRYDDMEALRRRVVVLETCKKRTELDLIGHKVTVMLSQSAQLQQQLADLEFKIEQARVLQSSMEKLEMEPTKYEEHFGESTAVDVFGGEVQEHSTEAHGSWGSQVGLLHLSRDENGCRVTLGVAGGPCLWDFDGT